MKISRWLLLVLLVLVAEASAHSLRPTVVTISLLESAQYEIQLQLNLEAMIAGVGSEHSDTDDAPQAARYNLLRTLPAATLEQELQRFMATAVALPALQFDVPAAPPELVDVQIPLPGDVELARKSSLLLRGQIPAGASSFVWAYPQQYGSSALRIRYGSQPVLQSYWLKPGQVSPPFTLDQRVVPRQRLDIVRDYTRLGFTHIVPLGVDHILFVVGIFLLSLQLRPILWQVTAFTLAHTLTLGMSIYGLISLSPAVVEPLIAASIVYVGVENVLTSRLHRWRVVIVFLFGLLHGMGFAGVLSEIGLPENEFLSALITFNVGVELGQLTVIALAFAAVGWMRRRDWYRQRVVIPLSALISLIGAYWMLQRLF